MRVGLHSVLVCNFLSEKNQYCMFLWPVWLPFASYLRNFSMHLIIVVPVKFKVKTGAKANKYSKIRLDLFKVAKATGKAIIKSIPQIFH